jgi:hypothetical protein
VESFWGARTTCEHICSKEAQNALNKVVLHRLLLLCEQSTQISLNNIDMRHKDSLARREGTLRNAQGSVQKTQRSAALWLQTAVRLLQTRMVSTLPVGAATRICGEAKNLLGESPCM